MKMIEFTIKTLESDNHQFSVEDETTVAQLKEQIRDQMGIEIGMQRLIFCGRVLTDERRLAEFGVNGKVIHLVPRPPPSPGSRNPGHNARQEMREAFHEAQSVIDRMSNQPTTANRRAIPLRHVWSIDPPSELVLDHHQALNLTPTANRLEFIRRIIDDIYNSLCSLFTHMGHIHGGTEPDPSEEPGNSGESARRPTEEPMDVDLSIPTPQTTNTVAAEAAQQPRISELGASEFRRQHGDISPPRLRSSPGTRPRLSRPRDLAQLIDELDELQQDFAPYRNYYTTILRDTCTDQLSEHERMIRQQIVELVCDIMHSFAHAYHAASDINVTIGERFPRLTSGFAANRHPIPVQAHINVVHTTRRPEANATASAANTSEGTPSNPIPTRAQPQTPLAATQRNAAGEQPSPIQPTGTNNTQAGFPEPVTYQVEIETRVPIAFPIDNALINGLAAVATNLQQAQNDAQSGQAQAQNQSQDQSQDQEGRPRVLSDIENLLRTLSQAHPGMEVVMSMEQIHPISTPPGLSPTSLESEGPTITFSPAFGATSLGQALGAQLIGALQNPLSAGNAPGMTGRPSGGAAPTGTTTNAPAASTRKTGTTAGATGTNAGVNAGANGTNADATAGATGTDVGATSDTATGATATAGVNAGTTGTGAAPGIGQNSTPNASRGGGAGNPFAHVTFGPPPFVASPFPGFGAAFAVGPDGTPTVTPGVGGVGVSALGPSSLTIRPDGGVFLAPMTGENSGLAGDIFHNVFSSMFRPNAPATTGSANTPPTNTGSPANTSSPATAAPTVTVNSTGNSPRTRVSNPTSDSAARRSAAMSFLSNTTSTPNNGTPTNANNTGRTSDSGWGFGNNLLYLENISPIQHDRLGPLSVMARARSLQQQAENRRRQHESNNHPHAAQDRSRQSGSNARAHHLAMACMVYDRFLGCESAHARQHLTERRSSYQRRHVAQVRQRARRMVAPDIDILQERNVQFTTRHMAIMMRLLSGPVCVEGRTNAFMVTVARVLYLEPDSRPRTYDPYAMPREFLFVRMQMREYIQRLLQNAIDANPAAASLDGVTMQILDSVTHFLHQISTVTPIDPTARPIAVVRAWLHARVPAIIACVMSETASDIFVSRFYGVFARFFTDLCALFMQMCLHGWDGLRLIYTMFINRLTEDYESTAREWIRLLSRENLMMIRSTIDPQSPINFYSHYRYDGSARPRVRQTVPLTTPPLLGPRNDTPDTMESLPSMSIPTMSSGSSETSGSPAPTDEPEGEASNECSPPLEEEENEAGSGADTVSTTSHNSRQRSPVQTRSAGTSPKHDTPDPAPQTAQSGDNEETERNRQAEARAPSPTHDRSHTSSSRSSPDSMRFVPPVMILEHWGEEWVPVFTRDQRAQRDRPQEPHSDAYLSGMPSRKRRCVRATRPPTTLDGFMTESVREATDRAASLDPTQLRSVIRDQVRSLVRTRADASEDFDPVRYSSAARFLDQTKQKKKETETKTEKD